MARPDVIKIENTTLIGWSSSGFDCDESEQVPWHAAKYPDSRPPKHPKGLFPFIDFCIRKQ